MPLTLNCTHDKHHPGSQSPEVPRSLTCCVQSPTTHMLHVKLLNEDGYCDAAGLQDRDAVELYAWQASSWKRQASTVASEIDLPRTQVPRPQIRTRSRGSPNSFTPRTSLSRYAGNAQTPQSLGPSHAFGTFAAKQIVSCLRSFKVLSSHPGVSSYMMQLFLAEKHNKLIVP